MIVQKSLLDIHSEIKHVAPILQCDHCDYKAQVIWEILLHQKDVHEEINNGMKETSMIDPLK